MMKLFSDFVVFIFIYLSILNMQRVTSLYLDFHLFRNLKLKRISRFKRRMFTYLSISIIILAISALKIS